MRLNRSSMCFRSQQLESGDTFASEAWLVAASRSLRQGCFPLPCLFILGVCMATNLPLFWTTGRGTTNAVCYNLFCHPPATRAQIFCWLINCAVALSNLVLMPTAHSVFTCFMAVIWVLRCQYSPSLWPLLYYLFLVLHVVIHISFITILIFVLQTSTCWPTNPVSLKEVWWGSMVILELTQFYASCPEPEIIDLPQQSDLSPGNLPSPLFHHQPGSSAQTRWTVLVCPPAFEWRTALSMP